jgi:hypothetical protein
VLYSEIIPERTRYLLEGRVTYSGVTATVGVEKVGKDYFWFDVISRITRGWPMPPYDVMDPTAPEGEMPGKVITITPEDGVADELVHRLNAAGADLSMVYDMSRVERSSIEGNTSRSRFSIPQDIPALRKKIQELGDVRMVYISPLIGVATKTISFNQQFRMNILDPLEELALDTGVAIHFILHFNKGVTEANMRDRVNGSRGILAALRITNVIVRDPLNPDIRQVKILTSNKKEPEPIEYTITGEYPDTHVRYRPPLPQVDDQNLERLQAYVLAMLVDAERPVSSQELSTYTRLSHGIVLQLLARSQAEGEIPGIGTLHEVRGSWEIVPVAAIEAPQPEEVEHADGI